MAQIVVIGLGRFGSHVARTLHRSGDEVLAIDSDPEQVERIKEDCSRAIVLDGRDKDRLEQDRVGALIRVSASQLNTPRVFSLIIYLSFLGLALYLTVVWLQRTLVFWNRAEQPGALG